MEKLFYSSIFKSNKAYVRRKLISLLLKDGELGLARKILVGAFLLIDGRLNPPTLEMMQEESAIACIVNTLWKRQSESIRLRRIFLELMYELCKAQKLRLQDLEVISSQFVMHLYTSIEERDDYDHDPYGYAIIKVLLALNEQYMIASYDLSVKQELDDIPLRRATSFPLTEQERNRNCYSHHIPNKIFETLVHQRDNFRVFGENIVFLLNRGPDDCLQLMVLKFLYLIFTTPETYDCLYLNDLKVIVDVFIRELCNLSLEEERLRHTYLRVLHPLLQNTELSRESYKRDEIVGVLEDMSENASKSVVDISETTQRLAFRCLFVEWLNHPLSHSAHASSLSSDVEEDRSEKEQVNPSNHSITSISTNNTTKLSGSPNSIGSPISPISSNSFTALSLEETAHSICKPPPPPPPSRTSRMQENSIKRAHRPVAPPAVPISRVPPPRPLPRKKSSMLNMSIRNTSVMELATYHVNPETEYEPSIRRGSAGCAPSYVEKQLPPLPTIPPAPPRPRVGHSHSYY